MVTVDFGSNSDVLVVNQAQIVKFHRRSMHSEREGLVILAQTLQWGESFSKHLWFAIVIVFLAEMGRILAVAGLNLLAQISDRISPFDV